MFSDIPNLALHENVWHAVAKHFGPKSCVLYMQYNVVRAMRNFRKRMPRLNGFQPEWFKI